MSWPSLSCSWKSIAYDETKLSSRESDFESRTELVMWRICMPFDFGPTPGLEDRPTEIFRLWCFICSNWTKSGVCKIFKVDQKRNSITWSLISKRNSGGQNNRDMNTRWWPLKLDMVGVKEITRTYTRMKLNTSVRQTLISLNKKSYMNPSQGIRGQARRQHSEWYECILFRGTQIRLHPVSWAR